jgi:hypothetical protein
MWVYISILVLHCAVTPLVFKYMFQELSVLHSKARHACGTYISVIFLYLFFFTGILSQESVFDCDCRPSTSRNEKDLQCAVCCRGEYLKMCLGGARIESGLGQH